MNRNSNRRIHPIAEVDGLSTKKPRNIPQPTVAASQKVPPPLFPILSNISNIGKGCAVWAYVELLEQHRNYKGITLQYTTTNGGGIT